MQRRRDKGALPGQGPAQAPSVAPRLRRPSPSVKAGLLPRHPWTAGRCGGSGLIEFTRQEIRVYEYVYEVAGIASRLVVSPYSYTYSYTPISPSSSPAEDSWTRKREAPSTRPPRTNVPPLLRVSVPPAQRVVDPLSLRALRVLPVYLSTPGRQMPRRGRRAPGRSGQSDMETAACLGEAQRRRVSAGFADG